MLRPYFEVALVLQLKNITESMKQKRTANTGNGGDVETKLGHLIIATVQTLHAIV